MLFPGPAVEVEAGVSLGFDVNAGLRRAMRNGGDYADLFVERAAPLAILCEDDRLEKVVAGREQGAGLRLISGQRTAYAYTNELTTASLLDLADAVGHAVSGGGGPGVVASLIRTAPASPWQLSVRGRPGRAAA